MICSADELSGIRADCLCGWEGAASEGVLKAGCDVAFSEKELAKARVLIGEHRRAWELLYEQATGARREEIAAEVSEGRRRDEEASARRRATVYVQCPRCGMTARKAGTSFWSRNLEVIEVPAC